jgi:GNAT superfamily N-acetyltransferase
MPERAATGITVRGARGEDLAFVSQDGYVRPSVVQEKIERGEVFVAEMDGTPVGYLRLEYLWSIQPYIALIRVLEPRRRRGVGRALLSHVEDAARAAGHRALFSSSQADEPGPQAWHRHMGFAECGVIHGLNEGGVGEIFFRKAL